MKKRTKLIDRLSKRLELDYVGSDRIRSCREVILVQIVDYETTKGEYRVALMCREVFGGEEFNQKEAHFLKDFLSFRIIGITDLDTGEVVSDISAYLAEVIAEAGGTQPQSWPKPGDVFFRTTAVSVRFGGDDYAIGWKFGVHRAFMAALDISYTGKILTEGLPPKYSFAVGDMFHFPAKPWGPDTLLSIQIQDVSDEFAQISLMVSENCVVVSRVERDVTQNVLADILMNGLTDEVLSGFQVHPSARRPPA
jgi:hypothetical protein